jgi:hemerythrin-like domain-containing protein
MNKPTKILSDEHQNILSVIGTLEQECNALESGSEIDKPFFENAVDFIKNYADKFHHAKEEDILFEELNKDSVQMHCNPTQQMLYEHEIGRKFVKGLVEGIEEGDKKKILDNASGYANLLREHIYKEDNILYPMADEALPQQVQDIILERFKNVETERFSNEIKEKYLTIVREFKERKH